MKRSSAWFSTTVFVLVAWLFVPAQSFVLAASTNRPPRTISAPAPAASHDTLMPGSFAPVVKKVAPSVVNIYSTKTVRENLRMSPLFNDPFFRRFFGFGDEGGVPQSRSRLEQSLGSGVIVTPDGYILTNNHVVEGADEIKVALANGTEYTARVIGTDPPTELAVVKVDATNLPAVTMGASDKLQVGDIVLAIGNPFGVGQTVTMGIVSATGRSGFGIVDYEDFVQTDASINPGNSGGALADTQGRLVGINTAILSRSGGNQGIGFAVPINMARFIMDQIIKSGRVVRGYLGVFIQPLTPELRRAFKITGDKGALIAGVTPDSPAAAAGIKEGDVVTEFNGKPIDDSRHLRLLVAQTAPKTKATVKLLRDGKERTLSVTLSELPVEEQDLFSQAQPGGKSRPAEEPQLEGFVLDELSPQIRRQLDVPPNIRGALITDVTPGSAAFSAGLRPGDLIVEVNRQPVKSAEEASEALQRVRADSVLLRVWSQGGLRYAVLNLDKPERQTQRR
ncbi:MAG: DegQ family serine endoprotease [Verrucomicrobiota bacterium]